MEEETTVPPTHIAPGVLSWASLLDDETRRQAAATARLPILAGDVALMPDAHLGKGATVGSVLPTQGAIIPAAVGVDVGCGMVAVETTLTAADLPDDLGPLLREIERRIPAGVGQGHTTTDSGRRWLRKRGLPATTLTPQQERTTVEQFGTLGSGNHYLEFGLDTAGQVWLMLHSGSRGIGNQLAQRHIGIARKIAADQRILLPDPDLAWLAEGTKPFDNYIEDLLWAQDYAAANRAAMAERALAALAQVTGRPRTGLDRRTIQCHHNYAARETHGGREIWVTRKGAIRARAGDLGVIPGSMGTSNFIVRGLGNPASYDSSAHGAGRLLSRSAARRQFSGTDLVKAMGDRTWLVDRAHRLVDEHPSAYKPIEQVMADQADLVEVVTEINQVLNFKGT